MNKKVSSLTFRPLKYLPTYFQKCNTRSQYVYEITRCRRPHRGTLWSRTAQHEGDPLFSQRFVQSLEGDPLFSRRLQCLSKEARFPFSGLFSHSKVTRFPLRDLSVTRRRLRDSCRERPDHRPTVDAKLLWSSSTPSRFLTAVVSLEGDQARFG